MAKIDENGYWYACDSVQAYDETVENAIASG